MMRNSQSTARKKIPTTIGKAGMRIINMNAIFLVFIGTIVRFSYFAGREVT